MGVGWRLPEPLSTNNPCLQSGKPGVVCGKGGAGQLHMLLSCNLHQLHPLWSKVKKAGNCSSATYGE